MEATVERKAPAHQQQKGQQYKPSTGHAKFNFDATSGLVERFFQNGAARVANSFIRVGTLLRMVANDEQNHSKISDWLDDVYSVAQREVATDKEALNVLADGQDLSGIELNPPQPAEPLVFYINHPKLIRFFNLLNDIDKLAYMTDKLWYLGLVTDEQREMSNKKLMYPINATADHFLRITDVARRKGGQYTPEAFIELLSEEKDMRSFITTHFGGEEYANQAALIKSRVGMF